MYGLAEEVAYEAAFYRTQATIVSDHWIKDRDTSTHYPHILALLQHGYRALRTAIDQKP